MTDTTTQDAKNDMELIELLTNQLTLLCGKNKVPILVAVQDSPKTYRTVVANEQYAMGPQLKMMKMLIKSGDVDSFLKEIIRDARTNGHRSLFLRAMGIPEETEK